MAVAREAFKKAEEENSRLVDERLALVMELRTMKDEFAAFREKAATDREIMEAEFDSRGRLAVQLRLWLLRFHAQHLWEQAIDPRWNTGSFNLAHPRVLCQPPLPPKHLVSRSMISAQKLLF